MDIGAAQSQYQPFHKESRPIIAVVGLQCLAQGYEAHPRAFMRALLDMTSKLRNEPPRELTSATRARCAVLDG